MRNPRSLFAVLASMALLAAGAVQAHGTPDKPVQAKPAPAAKAAAKAADAKATTAEGAAAVRTTPADLQRSSEKEHDGCGHGKMAAGDA